MIGIEIIEGFEGVLYLVWDYNHQVCVGEGEGEGWKLNVSVKY